AAANVTAFVVAFVGSVALWWIYFDQSADAAAAKIARSDDPGALGRSAYHLIHPVMVAGIIVAAAADQKVLSEPGATASTASAWMILGGPALFLAGHAAFKLGVWPHVPWPRAPGAPARGRAARRPRIGYAESSVKWPMIPISMRGMGWLKSSRPAAVSRIASGFRMSASR